MTQLTTSFADLERLVHRGRELRNGLASDLSMQDAARAWQQDCAALINRLSGGSKAHWLARAYSQAFLLRSSAGAVIETASMAEIVERIVDVLLQARSSLSQMGDRIPDATPRIRRFDFVHNEILRPVLEQAYRDSRSALDEGRFGTAFITSCGILETIITDALERIGQRIADGSFETRIAAAERAGLIRGGCARLPPRALKYRDFTQTSEALNPDATISEHEARLAGQVLRVVMRDLDPGR